MLFLIDVDHVSFEKAKETRQINLQSAKVVNLVCVNARNRRPRFLKTAVRVIT